MKKSAAQHPHALQFLAVYEELVRRGEWRPKYVDPDLPALVWVDLVALWTVANRNGLRMPLPALVLPRLRRPPPSPEFLYPYAAMSRLVAKGEKAREHYIFLHDPFDDQGKYPPSAAYHARLDEQERARLRQDFERDEAICSGSVTGVFGSIETAVEETIQMRKDFC